MSIWLPGNYRVAFSLDSVVETHVAQAAAEAYVAKTGKSLYVPGLGVIEPEPEPGPEPEPEPDPEAGAETVETKPRAKS